MDKEILATLAVGYQRLDDENNVMKEIFGKSLIIPGDKINAILVVTAFIFFFVCATFGFIWYLVRPL